jgi:hypothetical protein
LQSDRNNALNASCWYCGRGFSVPLVGLNGHQREAVSLIYNSHPSKQFTDERVHAAFLWFPVSGSEIKKYEAAKREQSTLKNMRPTRRSNTASQEMRRRKYEELKQRALEFHRAQIDRFKNLAQGPKSFPIDETIQQTEAQCVSWQYEHEFRERLGLDWNDRTPSELESSLEVCVSHLEKLKRREACEMVLWGALSPDVPPEIEFFEKEIKRVINEAVETHRLAEQQRLEADAQARHRQEEAKRAEAERVEAVERAQIQSTTQASAGRTRFASNLSEEAQMATLERFFRSINQGSYAVRPSYGTARYRPEDR